jgi:hypothetical protein
VSVPCVVGSAIAAILGRSVSLLVVLPVGALVDPTNRVVGRRVGTREELFAGTRVGTTVDDLERGLGTPMAGDDVKLSLEGLFTIDRKGCRCVHERRVASAADPPTKSRQPTPHTLRSRGRFIATHLHRRETEVLKGSGLLKTARKCRNGRVPVSVEMAKSTRIGRPW